MRRRLLSMLCLIALLGSLSAGGVRDTFALVLSGGGGRAFAEIAVLKELDRRGIVPDIIVGSGTGALIGGLYAAGYTGQEIEDLLRGDTLDKLIYSLDLSWPGRTVTGFLDYDADLISFSLGEMEWNGSGLVDDQYLDNFLERVFCKVSDIDDFDWLPVSFRATAADVNGSSLVILDSGSLAGAVRASMSTPLLLAPIDIGEGRVVMDGGLGMNLPVEIAKDLYSNTILAVDVNDTFSLLRERSADVSTLDGALNAFNEFMMGYGLEESYDKADWVIVTDTSSFSTLSFSAMDEILSRGDDAVEAAEEVFDELEVSYGGRSRTLYRDIEAKAIKDIRAEGMGIPGQVKALIGAPLDDGTLAVLDEQLSEVREREKLRRVTYRIEDSVITINAEPYPSTPGEVSLGIHGRIGLFYGSGSPYLGYYPEFTAKGYVGILPGLDVDFGAQVDQGIKGYAGLTYYFSPRLLAFTFLELRYGEHSWTSVMGTEAYDFSDSIGTKLALGISFEYGSRIRLETLLGADYTWVAAGSTDGLGSIHDTFLYWGLGFSFDGYEGKTPSDTGIDADITLKAGIDFPDIFLGYEASFSFHAVGSPSEYLRFVLDGEAVSLRRPGEYAAAWKISKTGQLTPDYAYLMGGVLIPLPASLYISAGIYLEATSSAYTSPHVWSREELIPFSTLDLEGLGVGGTLSFGVQLGIGRIGIEIYMADTARISLIAGLE